MVNIEKYSVSSDNHYEILVVNANEQLIDLEKLYIKRIWHDDLKNYFYYRIL